MQLHFTPSSTEGIGLWNDVYWRSVTLHPASQAQSLQQIILEHLCGVKSCQYSAVMHWPWISFAKCFKKCTLLSFTAETTKTKLHLKRSCASAVLDQKYWMLHSQLKVTMDLLPLTANQHLWLEATSSYSTVSTVIMQVTLVFLFQKHTYSQGNIRPMLIITAHSVWCDL